VEGKVVDVPLEVTPEINGTVTSIRGIQVTFPPPSQNVVPPVTITGAATLFHFNVDVVGYLGKARWIGNCPRSVYVPATSADVNSVAGSFTFANCPEVVLGPANH
jgi:hypothetical protein